MKKKSELEKRLASGKKKDETVSVKKDLTKEDIKEIRKDIMKNAR